MGKVPKDQAVILVNFTHVCLYRTIDIKHLRPYYTMRWVCVLVTSNIPKREKKRDQLAFLPKA